MHRRYSCTQIQTPPHTHTQCKTSQGASHKTVQLGNLRSVNQCILVLLPTERSVVQSTLSSHQGWVVAVHWSPESEHQLLSGSYDSTVRMWDIRSNKTPLFTIAAHERKVLCLDWSLPKVCYIVQDENISPRTQACGVCVCILLLLYYCRFLQVVEPTTNSERTQSSFVLSTHTIASCSPSIINDTDTYQEFILMGSSKSLEVAYFGNLAGIRSSF